MDGGGAHAVDLGAAKAGSASEVMHTVYSNILIRMNRLLGGVVLSGALLLLAGCGGDSPPTIALLLPGSNPPHYESTTRAEFEKAVKGECPDCKVAYRNARGKYAVQEKQARSALARGADVLVLSPVAPEYADGMVKEADVQGVPVVNYKSLVLEAKPTVLVSFDDVKLGELQGELLAEELAAEGHPKGPIVVLFGEPGNRDQRLFRKGARAGFAGAGIEAAQQYFTPFWGPEFAEDEMAKAIQMLGPQGFAGVYAENDGIAEGAIAAMRKAGIDPSGMPITGYDATIRGLRRVLYGTQSMTAYKPIAPEAKAGATVAVELGEGGEVPENKITGELENEVGSVPSILLEPVVVTRSNLGRRLAADRFVSAAKLCAGGAAAACKAAGLSP
jgi:D-xylose transport system substrate-binding protein